MLKDICSANKALWTAWREPPATAAEQERYHDAKLKAESGIFDDSKAVCRALLRYRRDGTGPIALALSDDPYKREVELAYVARATEGLLKILRPEVQP